MATSFQAKEIWSDLDHRFRQDGQGNLKKVVNVAAVMSSIDNILRTNKGERVMLPQFGSGLRSMLFEGINQTLMKFTSRQIREAIETWDDRVIVSEVELSVEPDHSAISVIISFIIKGLEDIFQYETTIRGE